ncbi:hypothetical protein O0L34_g10280 [Tuta absoluta]|nr:hypothetical protein O0L34_g10280 [Tuta absoluta]
MPSGIRQTDSSVIKNSLSNLEAQVSAQSDEISALKALIVRLTSVVERLNEGGSEKCNKCNSDRAEFESALSASETEDASLPARKKRTRRRRKNVAPLTEENRSSLLLKKAPKPPTKQQELKSPSKNEVPNTVSEQNKNDDAPYIRVTHKRPNKHRNKQVVRCSGDPSDFLCAAERIRYLHVWGARLDTTEANVITYLNTKNTSSLYSVKKMLPKRQTDYATFKLCDDLHLIAATETNLDGSVTDAEVCEAGGEWTLLRRDRCGRDGGGVLLAARAPLLLERLPRYETSSCEDLWARFSFEGHSIYVCVIYIPPRSSDDHYMTWFHGVENVCSLLSPSKILVFGDLNLYSASTNVNNYYHCFSTLCNLEQYNEIRNSNDRILDVVLTSLDLRGGVSVRAAEPAEVITNIDVQHPPLMEFWQYTNTLRNPGGRETRVTRDGDEYTGAGAAGAFADHFRSVFQPDAPALDPAAASATTPPDSRHVDVRAFTRGDIRRAIARLKPGTSPGPDNIPAYVIKGCADELLEPILFLFNLILNTGTYPSVWKKSRVTPIPKSGTKTKVENYRPIAILSALAKVFEMTLHNLLLPQCMPHITAAQHAFLPKRSVTTNLTEHVDYVSCELDARGQVDVIYLDFQKALDCVHNDTLLIKLGTMGFTPRLLKLFANYLSDRQQYVKYGPYVSNSYHTRSGISQGSNLGPFLFVLLINDLPDVVQDSHISIFADDVKLMKACRSQADCDSLQRDINSVHRWSIDNNLHFNYSKCEMMTFSRSHQPLLFQYSVGGTSMARVQRVRDLGVQFDPQLTFRDHVLNVAIAANRRLGFVLRNSASLTPTATQTLYAALVRSILETSSNVWSPHEDKYILMLEQVQKRFLRSLYKKVFSWYPYMYPTLFIQGQLGYQSLEVRRSLALARFFLGVLKNKIDSSALLGLFLKLSVPDVHQLARLRPRARGPLAAPPTRTVNHEHSPVASVISLLNSVLVSNPQHDLCMTGLASLMKECKLVVEMNARGTSIKY